MLNTYILRRQRLVFSALPCECELLTYYLIKTGLKNQSGFSDVLGENKIRKIPAVIQGNV